MVGEKDMALFTTFPEIETKNLLLRRMSREDNHDIFQMRHDPKMIEFTDSKIDETLEATNSYIEAMNKGVNEGKWIIWAIEHKQSKKVIGSISIWNFSLEKKCAELGYGIIPEYQNRGFMKEALLRVVDYGFDVMKLSALEAYTEEKNIRSNKLLQGCQFFEVKRVDEEGYYSNRIFHMIVYRRDNV
jgi:ribosomal-protein-alanine N-acetyltransferase